MTAAQTFIVAAALTEKQLEHVETGVRKLTRAELSHLDAEHRAAQAARDAARGGEGAGHG